MQPGTPTGIPPGIGPPGGARPPDLPSDVPWRASQIWLSAVLGLLLGIVLVIPVVPLMPDLDESNIGWAVVGALIYVGQFVAFWYFCLHRNKVSLTRYLNLPSIRLMPVLLLWTIGTLIAGGIATVLSQLAIGRELGTREQQLFAETPTGLEFFLMALVIGIWGPLVEEFLFRGILFDFFRSRMSKNWTLLLTAGIFSAAHLSPVLAATFVVYGLALGYIRARYSSVLASACVHIAINLIGLTVAFSATGSY